MCMPRTMQFSRLQLNFPCMHTNLGGCLKHQSSSAASFSGSLVDILVADIDGLATRQFAAISSYARGGCRMHVRDECTWSLVSCKTVLHKCGCRKHLHSALNPAISLFGRPTALCVRRMAGWNARRVLMLRITCQGNILEKLTSRAIAISNK